MPAEQQILNEVMNRLRAEQREDESGRRYPTRHGKSPRLLRSVGPGEQQDDAPFERMRHKCQGGQGEWTGTFADETRHSEERVGDGHSADLGRGLRVGCFVCGLTERRGEPRSREAEDRRDPEEGERRGIPPAEMRVLVFDGCGYRRRSQPCAQAGREEHARTKHTGRVAERRITGNLHQRASPDTERLQRAEVEGSGPEALRKDETASGDEGDEHHAQR